MADTEQKQFGIIGIIIASILSGGSTWVAIENFMCAPIRAEAEAYKRERDTAVERSRLMLGQMCEYDRASGRILIDSKCWGSD